MKKSLNRYVLTDEIYSLLKEQIVSHQIAAGEKINIDQLGRELEVSNIPIREALSRLAAEGFVDVVPFKGMYAANMSLQELDDMFEIRLALEGLALRKAAPHIPDGLLADLERDMGTWAAREPQQEEEKIAYIAEMNRRLHGLILDHCGNESLKQLVGAYIERIQRYLSFAHREMERQTLQTEWQEHMAIIHRLSARQPEEAEQALLAHIRSSHERTRDYFR
ncbi:MAG: GntR family transcriptional regulator [Paenibacillaceae bacterium]|nr:GntR family transcriptional regulator [Paenibacillaceae bacterium]